MRLAERQRERLHAVRMLVQQKPQIRRRPMRRRDRQKHAAEAIGISEVSSGSPTGRARQV